MVQKSNNWILSKMHRLVTATILICLFVGPLFAHSGRTNSAGCHAGSVPYHCHTGGTTDGRANSGKDSQDDGIAAWDLNLGYRVNFDSASPAPYFGLSIGKQYGDKDINVGADLGIQFSHGFYFGYVSTSNSVQLGYSGFHLSLNSDAIGLGVRFPYSKASSQASTIYFSSSALFGVK